LEAEITTYPIEGCFYPLRSKGGNVEELERMIGLGLIGLLTIALTAILTSFTTARLMIRRKLISYLGKPTMEEYVETLSDRLHWLEAQIRVAFEGFNRPVMFADSARLCTYTNRAWSRLTGMPPEDAMQLGWLDAVHPDDRERIEREWNRLNGKRWFEVRFRIKRPDGLVIATSGYAVAVVCSRKKLLGFVAVMDVEKVTTQSTAV
jgi:PAS domain S-box-containing protein